MKCTKCDSETNSPFVVIKPVYSNVSGHKCKNYIVALCHGCSYLMITGLLDLVPLDQYNREITKYGKEIKDAKSISENEKCHEKTIRKKKGK